MQERRVHRLESLIKERVATVLQRDMADPRLGLVTITRVKLDRELSSCKIYWSVLGDAKQRRLNERTLHHAAGFVRREIAAVLHTRNVPYVTFVYDESVSGALRIDAILKELRASAPAAGTIADEADPGASDGDDPATMDEPDDEPDPQSTAGDRSPQG